MAFFSVNSAHFTYNVKELPISIQIQFLYVPLKYFVIVGEGWTTTFELRWVVNLLLDSRLQRAISQPLEKWLSPKFGVAYFSIPYALS
jgi:hypothetical protein